MAQDGREMKPGRRLARGMLRKLGIRLVRDALDQTYSRLS
jgi:hypothetical protein